jgi:hypothetical protein
VETFEETWFKFNEMRVVESFRYRAVIFAILSTRIQLLFAFDRGIKAHTDRTRFGNATQIFSFQKQIQPSTDKNFTRYADQIATIA